MGVSVSYAAEEVGAAEIASSNVGMAVTSLADGGLAGLGVDGAFVSVVITNDSLNPIGFSGAPGGNGALDQLSDGNIVIATESGGTLNYRIIDGTTGDEVRPNTTVEADGLSVHGVAALSGGGFLVATTDVVEAGDNDVVIRRFNAAGNEQAGVGFIGGTNDYGAAVTGLADGGFAVAWTRELSGGATQVWHAVYNANGSVRALFDLVDGSGTTNRNASIVTLANGGYAIAYEDSSWPSGGTEITLARFSATGVFQGSIQATTGGGTETEAVLARLSNGMLALSFTTDAAGNKDVGLQLITADAASALIAAPQALLNGAGDQFDPSIAEFSTASFVLSATGAGADAREYRVVRTSTGDSAGDSVTGDDAVDRMFGNGGGDSLRGRDGDDRLHGDGGYDSLDGGDGDDTLLGGDHPDTLIGGQDGDVLDAGAGSDSVTGGAGDDFVLAGFGPDTMAGGPGNDTLHYADMAGETFLDLGSSAAQNTHSSGLDTIIGFENAATGAGDDRVLGSGQANHIRTLAGMDTIKAADGADTIDGGEGADKLNGGGGADWVGGGGGADRMLGGLGGDLFIYSNVSDSTPGAGRDVIRDFRTSDGDKIFLSYGLTYIGDAAFDGAGPQVRVEATAEGQLVQVDTDGGGTADMEILVRNSGLTGGASDFEL